MYDYIWDSETGGYLLTTGSGKFVANEIRPAFAQELALTGLNRRLRFDSQEERPLLWAQKNAYYYIPESVKLGRAGIGISNSIQVK